MSLLNLLKRRFWSTNHKDIGTLYFIFGGFAGIVGTFFSVFINWELFEPGNQALLGNFQLHNVIVTAHALIMIFYIFYIFFIFVVILNFFVLIYVLNAVYLAPLIQTKKCSQLIFDKILKIERYCCNYVWKGSENFLCFVHENQNRSKKMVASICQAAIVNDFQKGVIRFCNKLSKEGSSFCGFHQGFNKSNLFFVYLNSQVTIQLSRILLLKEILYKLATRREIIKRLRKYYYGLYVFLDRCLYHFNRIESKTFMYSEQIDWRFFLYPIGFLEPNSISIFSLPISILQLLIHKGQILMLNNHILHLLFWHHKRMHSGDLFYRKYPLLAEILHGKYKMELHYLGRSLLNTDFIELLRKIFPKKLTGKRFDIGWNDFIKFLIFNPLTRLKFIQNFPDNYIPLWTLLKVCKVELTKMKDFFWFHRSSHNYVNFFMKFRTTAVFKKNEVISKQKAFFLMLIVNNYFLDLFIRIKVYLGFPDWFQFIKLGYVLVQLNEPFDVFKINIFLSKLFIIKPNKTLFIFNNIDLGNYFLVSFISRFFKISFEHGYTDVDSYYLVYNLKKDWSKNLILNSPLTFRCNFQINQSNLKSDEKNVGLLKPFINNHVNSDIQLFKNFLNRIIVNWKIFKNYSLDQKNAYLNDLKVLVKRNSPQDFVLLKNVAQLVSLRLIYALKLALKDYMTNRLGKKSIFGYLILFLTQSLKLIFKFFPDLLVIISQINFKLFVQEFLADFLNKKSKLYDLIKSIISSFRVQNNKLQSNWVILNPILQQIIQNEAAIFFIQKLINYLFLNNQFPNSLKKKVKIWIVQNFGNEIFMQQNGLLAIYIKFILKFILIWVHAKIIKNSSLAFNKSNDKYKTKSWIILAKPSGLNINSELFTLPYLGEIKPKSYKINGKTKNNDALVKPPINGKLLKNVFSRTAIRAVNVLQNSSFRINESYLFMLKEADRSGNEMPWPTKFIYLKQLRWFKKMVASIPHLLIKIKAYLYLKKRHQTKDNWLTQIQKYLRLSRSELKLILKFEQQLIILKNMAAKRKFFLRTIMLASKLKGYKMSFSVFLDYRYRMYYLFQLGIGPSAANYLKPLLKFNKKLKLTAIAFYYVLRSFYSKDILILKRLDDFYLNLVQKELKNEQNIMFLINFFFCNVRNVSSLNLSERLLQIEINNLITSKSFFTNLLITIDQKCSSLVIYSVLFRDHNLARRSNLITKKPNDVYEFLQKNLIKWLKSKNVDYSNKRFRFIIKMFKKHRILLKSATMKFIYSQKWSVRLDEWVTFFKENLKLSHLDHNLYNKLKWISIHFESFIRFVFPALIHNISLLKKIFRLSVDTTNQISFQSPDNCTLIYRFFNLESTSHKIWDEKKNKYRSVRVRTKTSKMTLKLKNKYLRSALPNLIHFLDSFILREIINQLKNDLKINELDLICQHDSLTIQACHVNLLYEKLRLFYSNSSNKTWLEDVVIRPIKLSMKSEQDKKKVDILFSQFILGKKWSSRYYNIHNLYVPELK